GEKPRQTHTVPIGSQVYWLTFRPDGKVCYVSARGNGEVAAVDTETKQVVARIPVGKEPKRLLVVTPPEKKGFTTEAQRHREDRNEADRSTVMRIALTAAAVLLGCLSSVPLCLCGSDPGRAEPHRSPCDLAAFPDGRRVLTANHTADSVSLVDV